MDTLTFTGNSIETSRGLVIMHEWERPIMKVKADWVCQNGGDILELGFGMGIASNYIQEHDINSHTICESHPEIIERLKEWASDKPNVRIIEGDWFDNLVKLANDYDGILLDTYADRNYRYMIQNFKTFGKRGCHFTWWEQEHQFVPRTQKLLDSCHYETETISVNPPPNDYFNETEYICPKVIYT